MIELITTLPSTFTQFAISCGKSSFLGFPTWYKYLDGTTFGQKISDDKTVSICQPMLRGINDVWLVIAALVEILIRVGTLISIGFIIWGGIQMIVSQGDPNGIKSSRETIQNAVIGLVITILATVLVNFVAGSFNAI